MSTRDEPLYLDHNATTPLLPEVVEAMLPFLRSCFGNPSSGHAFGARARVAVARAREQVAALLGCEPDEVVLTSGGTEANNLAIRGLLEALDVLEERSGRRPRGVLTSAVEHPATAGPCAWLARRGAPVTTLGVDAEGRLDLDEARTVLAGGGGEVALVTVMHAQNETGVLMPVRELARLGRASGAFVHTDAAQSVGKVDARVDELEVDLLSLAGHKLYAPKGVGALYVRRGTPLAPLVLGAGHERGLRPGTENVASIVGLGVACEVAARELFAEGARVSALRDELGAALARAVPGLVVTGQASPRLPNTLHVRFPKARGSAVLEHAPTIAASTGSACHAGHERASAVLVAMGIDPEDALGSVRLTLGRGTTAADVDEAATALAAAYRAVASGER
jgi:cysteine desulfurase